MMLTPENTSGIREGRITYLNGMEGPRAYENIVKSAKGGDGARLMQSGGEMVGPRWKVGLELIKREWTNGIGSDSDIINEAGRVFRNAAAVLLRGTSQIIPSIANAGSKQQFRLYKGGEPADPVINAGANIVNTARTGNLLGTASAVVAEAPDVFFDVPLTIAGASQYHIRAIANNSRSSISRSLAA